MKWTNKFDNLKRRHNNHEHALFWARDYTFAEKGTGNKKTVKTFASAPVENIFKLMKKSPAERIMYEYLQSNDLQCFVLDVDYKYGKDGPMTEEECHRSLMQQIIPAVEKTAKELGVKTVVQPQLFTSCRKDKFSYHVHFPSYYFANRNIMSYFASRVWEQFRIDNVELMPDKAIYGHGKRAFRFVYNSKSGNPDGAKCPVYPSLSTVDKATPQDFSKMLARTQHEDVPIISSLDGYCETNKYGQPGGRVSSTRAKKNTNVKKTDLTDVNDVALEEKYIAALQRFHEDHPDKLTWNRDQVYSVRRGDKVEIRIQPGGIPTKCWAGVEHDSNGIIYTLDPISLRVDGTSCFGSCNNKNTRLNQKITNGCSDECTESSGGRVHVHVCSKGSGDLVTVLDGDEEHYEFCGPRICTCERGKCKCAKYHDDALISDLFGHIDEVLDPNEECNYSTFYLTGSMGSGKTTALKRLLEHFTTVNRKNYEEDPKMLVHTSRQALAYQLFDTLRDQDFVVYKNLQSPSDAAKLIMQVESTHKLFDKDDKGSLYGIPYDVLVVDEAFAHLKQLVANTMSADRQIDTIRYFNWLLRTAKLVIVLCADTQQGDFVFKYFSSRRCHGKEDWEHSEQVFRVISPAAGLTIFMESAENVQAAVCCALDQGEHVWFSTNSRQEALLLKQLVQGRAEANKNRDVYNGVLLVSGDKRDISEQQKREVLDDKQLTRHTPKQIMGPDGTIKRNKSNETSSVKLFIYTPAITHGFSFDDKEGYFTKFMAIFRASDVPARDCRQQLKRNRNCRSCLVGIRQKIIDDEQDSAISRDAALITENNEMIRAPAQHQQQPQARILDRRDMDLIDGAYDDAEISRNELAKFYEQEALKSKRSFKKEFIRLCGNDGIHVVFVKDNSDGYIGAHGELVNELTKWTHLQKLCQQAAQTKPDKHAPEGTPERFHFNTARMASSDTLVGCPKTLAVIHSLHEQIELFGKAVEGRALGDDGRVFLTILGWLGIRSDGNKVSMEALERLQSIHKTFQEPALDDHLLTNSDVYVATFRIVYSNKPKKLKKLPILRDNWSDMTRKKKIQSWNSMCNHWLKQHLGELIDTTASRPKITRNKLRVAWPLKAPQFQYALQWANALVTCNDKEESSRPGIAGLFHSQNENSIKQLFEDKMPDICNANIEQITSRLNEMETKNQLECSSDSLKRGTSTENKVAAQYRIANWQNNLRRTEKIPADEYLSTKRRAGLAFPNAIYHNKKQQK